MHCPLCDRENADTSSFCIYCGAELHNVEDETDAPEIGPDAPEQQRVISGLTRDVRQLRREMRQVLSILSRQGATAAIRQPMSPNPAVGARPAPETPVSEPSFWDRVDLEPIVGGNWLARIGVVAIVIGTAFFLKLAFDNNWIGETGRVALGIATGLAFLGAGERWRARYPVYSQALVGGGVALTYLTIFAAYAIFGLIPMYPGVGLLALVSVASATLAIRHESMALAVIGILGAFIAPFVAGSLTDSYGQVNDIGPSFQLMAYIIVVDVSVLALSTFRNWRWFTTLA